MTNSGKGGQALLWTILAFLVIFLVYPIGSVLAQAFFPRGRFSLEFFSTLFGTAGMLDLWLRSLNLALGVTLLASALAFPAAIFLSRTSAPAQGLVQTLLLLPLVVPPFVGAVGLRRLLARFGTINILLMKLGLIHEPLDFLGSGGIWAVALTEALHLFPIIFLNLMAAFSRLDLSYEEAAKNVGAGALARFRRIVCPLIFPGYFAGASIVLVWAFTDLGTPLIFEVRDLLAVRVYSLLDEMHTNPASHALVVSVLAFVAVLFMTARWFSPKSGKTQAAKGVSAAGRTKLGGLGLAAYWLMVLVIVPLALLPHFGIILTAFADRWFMSAFPTTFTLHHIEEALIHPLTVTSIRNSLVLSLSSTAVSVVLGISLGYLGAHLIGWRRHLLEQASMLPLAIPGLVLAFGYLESFSGTMLDARINPFPLLIIGYSIRRLPFMVRAVAAGFEQSNLELEEAAKTVGAAPWQVFRRITLPLISKHVLAGAILCFAFAMLEVSESLMLAMEERFYPLSKAIYVVLARPDGLAIAAALGVLSMLLVSVSLLVAGRLMGKRFGEVFSL
jgi:iron(III) transport system permease protein